MQFFGCRAHMNLSKMRHPCTSYPRAYSCRALALFPYNVPIIYRKKYKKHTTKYKLHVYNIPGYIIILDLQTGITNLLQ
jgi:hypothetical protein